MSPPQPLTSTPVRFSTLASGVLGSDVDVESSYAEGVDGDGNVALGHLSVFEIECDRRRSDGLEVRAASAASDR